MRQGPSPSSLRSLVTKTFFVRLSAPPALIRYSSVLLEAPYPLRRCHTCVYVTIMFFYCDVCIADDPKEKDDSLSQLVDDASTADMLHLVEPPNPLPVLNSSDFSPPPPKKVSRCTNVIIMIPLVAFFHSVISMHCCTGCFFFKLFRRIDDACSNGGSTFRLKYFGLLNPTSSEQGHPFFFFSHDSRVVHTKAMGLFVHGTS